MNLNNVTELSEWERNFKEFTDFISNHWDGTIEQIMSTSNLWPNFLGAGSAGALENVSKTLELAERFSDSSSLSGIYAQQVASNNFLNKIYSSSKLLSGAVAGSAIGIVAAAVVWEQGGSNDLEELNKAIIGAVGSAAIASAITPLIVGIITRIGLVGVGGVLLGTLATGLLVGVTLFLESDTFDRLYDDALDSISDLFNWRPTPPVRRDPLILDLNGDGIHLTNLEEGVFFDQNANGIKNLTQWISPEDGLLVLDRNENGTIDNGSELFGDSTSINLQGDTAANGYDALAVYDINGDGQIDQHDNIYNDLKVWVDKNSDGVSQESELFTLADAGVASISLDYETTNLTSSYTDNDQVEHNTQSVILDVSNYYREFTDTLEISNSIKLLPNMKGTGTVRDLQEAATLSSAIEQDLENFITETDRAQQLILVESIMVNWAKTSEYYSEYNEFVSGPIFDKIYIVEAFAGDRVPWSFTVGTSGAATAIPTEFINNSYDGVIKMIYLELANQTTLKPYIDAVSLKFDSNGISFDVSNVVTLLSSETLSVDVIATALDLTSAFSSFTSDDIYPLTKFISEAIFALPDEEHTLLSDVLEFNDVTLSTTDGITEVFFESSNLKIIEGDSSVYIDGTSASETLIGTDSADIINSGAGNDTIYGQAGNDTLSSQSGNSTLDGGAGNDTLTARYGYNTLIGGTGDDTLTLDRSYGSSSTYDYYSNTLEGGQGDDRLEGHYGADSYVFNVGDGQDVINDIGGTDKIIFGEGISQGNLKISRDSSNSIIITVLDSEGAATGDSVTIENAFSSSAYRIESLEFTDGTSMDWNTIYQASLTVDGTEGDDILAGTADADTLLGMTGNDTLSSYNGNDILDGGAGNDTLTARYGYNTLIGGTGDDTLTLDRSYGSSSTYDYYSNTLEGGQGDDRLEGHYGADSYVFNVGDGQDVINDIGGTDKIIFGEGISQGNLKISRDSSNSIIITVLDSEGAATGDSVTIENALSSSANRIESLEFTDGTSMDWNTIYQASLTVDGTEGDDILSGTADADTLLGMAGNDTLASYNGNDILDGGAGNDTLTARYGYNTLIGGTGDDRLTLDRSYGSSSTYDYYSNTLEGGQGNDRLEGHYGAESYVFNVGDGQDVINDIGGTDKIIFGEGISQGNLKISRDSSNSILITVLDSEGAATGDSVTIENALSSSANRIESLEFTDGTSMDWNTIYQASLTVDGTEGDDILSGTADADTLLGMAGNDTLASYNGNDILDGGAGNDTLTARYGYNTLIGGTGDDRLTLDRSYGSSSTYDYYSNTLEGGQGNDRLEGHYGAESYVFNVGDGQDVINDIGGTDKIIFGEGLTSAHIRLTHDSTSTHLFIELLDDNGELTGDSITVQNAYSNSSYEIENFEFADGSSMTLEEIKAASQVEHSEDTLDKSLQKLVQSYSSFDDGGDEDLLNEPSSSAYFDVIETNYI